MAEQTGGGHGDARSNPAAGKTPLARRPRASLASSPPAATETAPWALRPLCEELADGPVHPIIMASHTRFLTVSTSTTA